MAVHKDSYASLRLSQQGGPHRRKTLDQQFSISINGGAFTTYSLAGNMATGTLIDTTAQIGSSTWSAYSPWYGAIAEALIFSESMADASNATVFATLGQALCSKYGITYV